DDGHEAPDHRVLVERFPRRARGLDARASGVQSLGVRQRSRTADDGRGPGRHHALLADQQPDLSRAVLLGEPWAEPAGGGSADDRRHRDPDCGDRVSGRAVRGTGELGPARLSQAHLLPRGREGWPLRRAGRAGDLQPGTSRGIQITQVGGTSMTAGTAVEVAIRPFRFEAPQDDLADLRHRLQATRWPDKETVKDESQGAQLAKLQALVRYWGTGYDWRKVEARLNALPQFTTNIDGLDIHFIHVKSRHKGALPLVITHGWTGSVIELLKIIEPLTDPTAHGGSAEDAFDVVIPSLPGYGFSGHPTGTGWDPDHIGHVWAELMRRLGYTHYVAQGGDLGAPIASAMARQAPAGL